MAVTRYVPSIHNDEWSFTEEQNKHFRRIRAFASRLLDVPYEDITVERFSQDSDGLYEAMRSSRKFNEFSEKHGEDEAYDKLKVWFSEGDGTRKFYHAGTVEDPALDRALRTLRSLVETQNRLNSTNDSLDIVDAINKELQSASQGKIALSWSAPSKNTEKGSNNCSKDAE